jgi:hypothetical protein
MPILHYCLHAKQMTTTSYVGFVDSFLIEQIRTMHGSGFDVVGHRISGEPLIVLASRFSSIQVLCYPSIDHCSSALKSSFAVRQM